MARTAIAPDVARDSFAAWQSANFADEAATIETPTLVIAPSADRPVTPDVARAKVQELIAGSTLEVLPDAGHYAILEQPGVLAARIERFADEL